MEHERINSKRRRSVNLSLNSDVVDAAKGAGVNISQISEAALRREVERIRDLQWQEDHREWIASNNSWVEANGLPLEKYRLF